jgi:excinuclease ABC subunit A
MAQLNGLVESGNTVVVIEHDMRVAAASDWIIDIGPGAGDEGGRILGAGLPQQISNLADSRTAPYLRSSLRPKRSGRRASTKRIGCERADLLRSSAKMFFGRHRW